MAESCHFIAGMDVETNRHNKLVTIMIFILGQIRNTSSRQYHKKSLRKWCVGGILLIYSHEQCSYTW